MSMLSVTSFVDSLYVGMMSHKQLNALLTDLFSTKYSYLNVKIKFKLVLQKSYPEEKEEKY